ncbi:M56 family metallopeptidase [Granulicella sp. S156]|uniref:M56 family metallopeptidase n=1 Tax=Granulicella sp. S156 TaxID=1747224 RepID=UPI00131D13AA|nr:M56 family metallopeptidase [Granulicella sp. S156]
MMPAFWDGSWTAAVVNHLWQSTVVAGIAWALALALRKNHARARYCLWMIASVKFLLPLSLLMAVGELFQSLVATPIVAKPALANVMGQMAQPFPQVRFFGVTEHSSAATHGNGLPVLLLTIWVCGALIIVLRWIRGWRSIRAAVRSALPLEIAADVPALWSTAMIEPGIYGIFRPVLLLPEGILERLTPEQLKAIVAHEMCHVRRRDNLTFAVHMIAEALFWFHPAVWWIGARLVDERERACDEAVLAAGSDAQVYAEGILNVCRFYVESPLECASGVTGSDLKERIVRIGARHAGLRLGFSMKILLGAVGLITIAVPVVFGLAQATKEMPNWQKAAGGKMAFEVATIKPAEPGKRVEQNVGLNIDDEPIPPGGRLLVQGTLPSLIEFAYKIISTREQQNAMLAHLPKWVASDSFVIEAKAEGNPTKDQMRLMIQSLLADRFNLALHFETQEMPALALVLDRPGKIGPRLRPHAEGLPCDAKWTSPPDPASPSVAPGGFLRFCGANVLMITPHHSFLVGARDITMQYIANYMPLWQDSGRPVVDRTGLAGTYDFSLDSVPERNDPSPPSTNAQLDTGAPTFSEALKEQLGLKLQPTRARIQVPVIDHVKQPSPN